VTSADEERVMNDLSRSYLAARAALPPTRLVPAWLALALEAEFGDQAAAIAPCGPHAIRR
jgi:hypothetical protein